MGGGGRTKLKCLSPSCTLEMCFVATDIIGGVITLAAAAASDALSNEIIVKMGRQEAHFMRACKEYLLVSICSTTKVLGITNSLGI